MEELTHLKRGIDGEFIGVAFAGRQQVQECPDMVKPKPRDI